MSDDNRPCETHQFEPVPGERNQYVCIACCATGYRSQFHKAIVPHKKQRKQHFKHWTAMDKTRGRGGRVPPKPGAE